MKTLILLIDFYGHPNLTIDSYSDNIRYSALIEICKEFEDLELPI